MAHTTTHILIWSILLLLSALFSATEMAFVTSGRLQYVISKRKGGSFNRLLDIVYKNYRNFLTTLSLGNLIVLVLFFYFTLTISFGYIRTFITENNFLVFAIVVVSSSIILIISGEVFPRAVTARNPDLWIKILIVPAFIFYIVLFPLARLLSFISKSILSMVGIQSRKPQIEPLARIELNDLIRKSIDDISDESEVESEVKILKNALDFSAMRIRDCMVPRADIVAVSEDADIGKLKEMFIESGISRILVYRDDIDNIIGYIHVWEMFSTPADWTRKIAELSYVPESMPADKLMNELMQEHKSIAVVIDEFGGTSGVVTIEDLVEEIFGEIEDEYDSQSKFVKKESENQYVLSGRVEIDTLNEEHGLDIPESEDYTTIAGYLLNFTQRFPKTYETIIIGKYTFKILKVTARKIEVVRLEISEED